MSRGGSVGRGLGHGSHHINPHGPGGHSSHGGNDSVKKDGPVNAITSTSTNVKVDESVESEEIVDGKVKPEENTINTKDDIVRPILNSLLANLNLEKESSPILITKATVTEPAAVVGEGIKSPVKNPLKTNIKWDQSVKDNELSSPPPPTPPEAPPLPPPPPVIEFKDTGRRFVRKSLENPATAANMYSRVNFLDTEFVETEFLRNLDDNIELLSREEEHLELQLKKKTEEKLSQYGRDIGKQLEERDQERKDKEKRDVDEDEPIGMSPCGRFFKYAQEVGRGSFKTVFRGLDTQTGVAVAWCELLVRINTVIF